MAVAKTSRRVLARVVAGQLLAAPAKHQQIMRGLAAFLVENKIAADAKLVMNDIAHELFAQGGDLPVTVTSASPLSKSSMDALESVLRDATGAKSISVTTEIDRDLLGGFVARTPDQEIDASIRARLKQLATIK